MTAETETTTARTVADAQTAFGLGLLRAVAARRPHDDLLLSPTSAAQALGLLYPRLAGPRAAQLGAVLRLPAWSAELAAALGEHTRALAALRSEADPDGERARDVLQVSNRLWTATRYHLDPAHLTAVRTAFGAEIGALDFAQDPAGATDRVNAAVAADTRGLIRSLFDQPLGRDTVLVLTNAVHLRARWASRFTSTAPAPFSAPTGTVEVPMMSGASGTARAAAGWQSVELPYRDGTLTAVALLPPVGTDPATADEPLLAALADAPPARVDVRLPRLHVEQTHGDLLEPLAELGVPVAVPELGPDARIDQVVQKVLLDVDQDGTVAAAATGVTVVATSFRTPLPEVVFDRPFLLLLTDTATRSPLFLALVRDPSR
ncbi:serpin family protein [Modestobacter sp. SYSU DS0290]